MVSVTTPQLTSFFREVINDIIIGEWGKRCACRSANSKLIECVNCRYDPLTGKSLNVYKNGGPTPFPIGAMCPTCKGTGKLNSTTESIEYITLRVILNPKDYRDFRRDVQPEEMRVPSAIIKIIGRIEDLPIISRCDVFEIEPETLGGARYKLHSDTINKYTLSQGKFFSALGERI